MPCRLTGLINAAITPPFVAHLSRRSNFIKWRGAASRVSEELVRGSEGREPWPATHCGVCEQAAGSTAGDQAAGGTVGAHFVTVEGLQLAITVHLWREQ